ncbi:hypothetical protein [Salinisphaera sp.]|uniref:hypothetical protein n=1 Tax=Salinisphaera sp. TaxID=1914330 RepID=UPI002D793CBB|nr:hypothetical protein [Salinisphaera sp.]HET7314805.1 hypothetical protein [Salinisphaera sp.]
MLKKTAIAVSLAMVAGTGMAAGNGMGMAGDMSGAAVGTTGGSLAARFHTLDTNNDGVLSPSEAQADPTVAKLYSAMDNTASIRSDPYANKDEYGIGGITLAQFMAGMRAASGGTAGPAVSGGETYTVMKDGSRRIISNSAGQAGGAMNRMQPMGSGQSMMGNGASRMNQGMQNGMSNMQNGMRNQTSSMHSNMQYQGERMRNNMQNPGGTMPGNGMSGQRMNNSNGMSDNGW